MNYIPIGPDAYGSCPAWGSVHTYGNTEGEEVPEAIPESDPVSLPQLVEAVVFSFQTVGQDEGLRTAAHNSQGQGPALVMAASEYIRTRRMSPDELEARIAELRAEEARAVQLNQPNAAQIARYKIEMLRRRQVGITQNEEHQAVRDLPEIQGQTAKWKENIPLIALGIGITGLLVTLGVIQVRKKRKT